MVNCRTFTQSATFLAWSITMSSGQPPEMLFKPTVFSHFPPNTRLLLAFLPHSSHLYPTILNTFIAMQTFKALLALASCAAMVTAECTPGEVNCKADGTYCRPGATDCKYDSNYDNYKDDNHGEIHYDDKKDGNYCNPATTTARSPITMAIMATMKKAESTMTSPSAIAIATRSVATNATISPITKAALRTVTNTIITAMATSVAPTSKANTSPSSIRTRTATRTITRTRKTTSRTTGAGREKIRTAVISASIPARRSCGDTQENGSSSLLAKITVHTISSLLRTRSAI
ncbi:hypothetical protein BDN72DRAFT_258053 [Pluteus cervinus]|uniref:Uncharacterized protein n=1 Tax=Pluteus cervinus TaxID=181527 RepID=A0ACD3B501_9AGAR|nr:hypothetical protein BDN72DRAFT_258053 [Pluteus cervinus]